MVVDFVKSTCILCALPVHLAPVSLPLQPNGCAQGQMWDASKLNYAAIMLLPASFVQNRYHCMQGCCQLMPYS